MLIRNILSACLILISFISYSQEVPVIQTDRPDQTECPYIVPAGFLQAEMGVNYEKADNEEENWLQPTVLWRYGINKHFEFRLITEWAASDFRESRTSGLNPVRIGFKALLCEEKGIIPQTGFIGHLIVPGLASAGLKADYYASTFRFVMAHTLNEKLSLSYNLGAEWDGFTPEPSFIYTLSLAAQLSEKMGCYLEGYGYFPQLGKPDHRADAGITFFFSKNLMMDISGGVGITPQSPDYYTSLGFSFRIPR